MGPGVRVENWPAILNEYVQKAAGSKFTWGEVDCCLFAADFVNDITGVDHAKRFRGKYKTPKGAAGALKRIGKGAVAETVSSMLSKIPVLMAQRGDVVAYKSDVGDALGICLGEHSLFLGPEGSVFVKTADCFAAWKVE